MGAAIWGYKSYSYINVIQFATFEVKVLTEANGDFCLTGGKLPYFF
jgi:hypothetical protein